MEVALEETLSRMESELQNIREEHPEDWFDEVPALINIFMRDQEDHKYIELYKDSYRFFLSSICSGVQNVQRQDKLV